MDDEIITWNLKGPKRMKKRRELNALVKNNLKYKSLMKTSSLMNSSKFNLSRYVSSNARSASCSNGGDSYLLRNQNDDDTSSGNEEFYFSANKSVIREKKRNYYCKIIKMILVGLIVTFSLLVGIILVFSYGKFHDIVNELKREVQIKNEENQKNINSLKQQLNEYDLLLKQFKLFDNRLGNLEKNISFYQKSSILSLDESNTTWVNAVNGELLSNNYNNKTRSIRSAKSRDQSHHVDSVLKNLLKNYKNSKVNQLTLTSTLSSNNYQQIRYYIENNQHELVKNLDSYIGTHGKNKTKLLMDLFSNYFNDVKKENDLN